MENIRSRPISRGVFEKISSKLNELIDVTYHLDVIVDKTIEDEYVGNMIVSESAFEKGETYNTWHSMLLAWQKVESKYLKNQPQICLMVSFETESYEKVRKILEDYYALPVPINLSKEEQKAHCQDCEEEELFAILFDKVTCKKCSGVKLKF